METGARDTSQEKSFGMGEKISFLVLSQIFYGTAN
jgi:hypothetical protein